MVLLNIKQCLTFLGAEAVIETHFTHPVVTCYALEDESSIVMRISDASFLKEAPIQQHLYA